MLFLKKLFARAPACPASTQETAAPDLFVPCSMRDVEQFWRSSRVSPQDLRRKLGKTLGKKITRLAPGHRFITESVRFSDPEWNVKGGFWEGFVEALFV